jgi:hypothetical protein
VIDATGARAVIVIAAGWFGLQTKRIIALFLGQDAGARVRLSPVCWQSMPREPEVPLVAGGFGPP